MRHHVFASAARYGTFGQVNLGIPPDFPAVAFKRRTPPARSGNAAQELARIFDESKALRKALQTTFDRAAVAQRWQLRAMTIRTNFKPAVHVKLSHQNTDTYLLAWASRLRCECGQRIQVSGKGIRTKAIF
jgi:hypothetical protein